MRYEMVMERVMGRAIEMAKESVMERAMETVKDRTELDSLG
jgi:hypothetical protein